MDMLNTRDNYAKLQSFQSVEDLNEAIKYHRDLHAEILTPSTRNVLDVLARYSCVYPGVSYRSKKEIAEELEIDIRTVRRACNLLEDLGVIKQHSTKRHNGDKRQSTNAIVVLKPSTVDVRINVLPECPPKEAPAKTSLRDINNTRDTGKTDLPTSAAIKELKDQERKAEEQVLLKEGLVDKLPTPIRVLAPFFKSSDLYQLSGIIFKAKASIDRKIVLEHHEGKYRKALLSVMSAYKQGKVECLESVIYTTIKRVTRSIKVKSIMDEAWEI
ncbi:helix-turn-helix domain-containing protein [Viridibacillus sp. FSL R5-0468]|uniref:helix-turn-helix domain-containing protein n=1 Tax=Viridibacillus sp. FSL R5-0468 TaxID=2921640 RepID=UPI0030F53115